MRSTARACAWSIASRGAWAARWPSSCKPHRAAIARFADVARPILSKEIPELWANAFPMIVPPDKKDGLGIILLNSNADTHFSFTNALGMVSAEQMRGVRYRRGRISARRLGVALHHHLMEYPWAAKQLSMRIGTALINGNWFVRRLQAARGPRHPHARPPACRLDRPYAPACRSSRRRPR